MHKEPLPPLPQRIGSYEVEKLLNRGGTSLVYLAKDPELHKQIVIKVISPRFLKSKEMVSRLFREANILKLSTHPNIIPLLNAGEWEGSLFIAMDYIPSISLRKFILTQKFSRQRALEILLQIAYGVAHLHGHGIVHRDLKPENILITESGDVKLIDFGIAQFAEAPGFLEQTQFRKKRVGTPSYMSPEQGESPETTSYASDIFSLGLIASELFLNKLNYGVLHISSLPKEFRNIVAKAVQIDPAQRYSDIIDFIADVTAYKKKTLEQEENLPPSDAAEWLASLRALSSPLSLSQWSQAQIGAARVPSCNGILHFFSKDPTKWGCLFLAPKTLSSASLLSLAQLKGAVLAIELETPDLTPSRLLQRLNQILFLENAFSCKAACLLLNSEKSLLSFASCQGGALRYSTQGDRQGKMLETPNPALGEEKFLECLEVEENWDLGSLLLFSKHPIVSLPTNLERLAPQPLAEHLLQQHPEKETIVAITR